MVETMSESDSLIKRESNKRSRVKCQSHLCLQSKAAILIVLWTMFIGIVYTTVWVVAEAFILMGKYDQQNHYNTDWIYG